MIITLNFIHLILVLAYTYKTYFIDLFYKLKKFLKQEKYIDYI